MRKLAPLIFATALAATAAKAEEPNKPPPGLEKGIFAEVHAETGGLTNVSWPSSSIFHLEVGAVLHGRGRLNQWKVGPVLGIAPSLAEQDGHGAGDMIRRNRYCVLAALTWEPILFLSEEKAGQEAGSTRVRLLAVLGGGVGFAPESDHKGVRIRSLLEPLLRGSLGVEIEHHPTADFALIASFSVDVSGNPFHSGEPAEIGMGPGVGFEKMFGRH